MAWGQDDPALLESCFTNSLRVAQDLGAASIAFPAISAGIYGWSATAVAEAAATATAAFDVDQARIKLVRFCLFGPETFAAFRAAFAVSSGL
jgi:O-acetyl-ADP-ribose deacetylase (regulator of RNase III)